jgi:predicted nucleotidyltransferase
MLDITIFKDERGEFMNEKKFESMLIFLVPEVISIIVDKHKITETEATQMFYISKVYELLEDEKTKLWHFSPLTLYNMFDQEQKTGEISFPVEG